MELPLICAGAMMRGQAGFWDIAERYARLSATGDPLEKLDAPINLANSPSL